MQASTPRVTVVMPVYNAERFVAEAVDSILRQTYTDFEFVVVDDGSTDRSVDTIRAVEDARIRLHENGTNLGHVVTLNRGVSLAHGSLIVRMDADDVAIADRLALQVAFLDSHPSVVGLSGAMQHVDENGRPGQVARVPTDSDGIRRWLAVGRNPLHHPAAAFRRSAFEAVGGYRSAFSPAEDFDLWLRLSERWELANLPDILLRYRVHSQQLSIVGIERQVLSVEGAIRAARVRASGGSDPFEDGRPVDRAALELMGADLAEIEGRIVERFTIAANDFLSAGRLDDALGAAGALRKVGFCRRSVARDAAFEADWISSRCLWAGGHRWRAVASLLRGSLRTGKWAGRLVRALERRLPSIT